MGWSLIGCKCPKSIFCKAICLNIGNLSKSIPYIVKIQLHMGLAKFVNQIARSLMSGISYKQYLYTFQQFLEADVQPPQRRFPRFFEHFLHMQWKSPIDTDYTDNPAPSRQGARKGSRRSSVPDPAEPAHSLTWPKLTLTE